jgi:hypothetical protein
MNERFLNIAIRNADALLISSSSFAGIINLRSIILIVSRMSYLSHAITLLKMVGGT